MPTITYEPTGKTYEVAAGTSYLDFCQENGILLTGDNLLRKVATARAVRVHGVLWIIDELHAAEVCEVELLVSALQIWRADEAVFLPVAEIDKRLRHLGA